jgi:protein-tyrosine phosphatase
MSDWFRRFGYAEVADGLLVGAYPLDTSDVDALSQLGPDVVFNLTEDVEYGEGMREQVAQALAGAGIEERRLPLVDYGGLPERDIERAGEGVLAELEAGRRVYLHCRAGWQRSAAVAAGVIALRDGMSIEDALERLRERKPTAEPLAHQRADLLAWYRRRNDQPG